MKEIKLTVNEVTQHPNDALRDELNEFVAEHWHILVQGAKRLNVLIPADYYAPQRIQIRKTRLHQDIFLKVADGHHWKKSYWLISEKELTQTVADIQTLLDAASEEVKTSMTLKIERK